MSETNFEFQPSMVEAVRALRERFPEAPFLTLGQTVLWDEPVKAAFCRVLEDLAPEASIVAGVHDTDYFAKLKHGQESTEKFVLLEHNDGDTHDLWSAAGEISSLFGSETVPTRAKLVENGVAFDRVARDYPGGAPALLNSETAAWGWRAIVHTEGRPLLAGEVMLADIAPALLQQMRWAFDESLDCLGNKTLAENDEHADACACPSPCEAREVAARIIRWVEEYAAANSEATLSELYRALTPRLWALVRGEGSCNLQTTHSLKLFRFNNETSHYPRFRFLDIFLNPETREAAKKCYDDAVRGSGIYTLDQFGAGALPFDVVLPGKGRGTLRLQPGWITIETEPPISVKCDDCDSVQKLAAALEEKYGDEVVIVGKAVSLISMLAHELIFVFHEKASSYTKLTQKMNAALRVAGIELNLHPLLRLEYSTWDALAKVPGAFQLPHHLAQAFGRSTICAAEFGGRWKEVCNEQQQLLEQFKATRAPRELMQMFSAKDESWKGKLSEYAAAREVIANLSREARELQEQAATLQATAKSAKAQIAGTEKQKGDHFRTTILPLQHRISDIKEAAAQRVNPLDEDGKPRRLTKTERAEQAELEARENEEVESLRARIAVLKIERASYDETIAGHLARSREAQQQSHALVLQRVEKERSATAVAARKAIAQLEYETELAKLRAVRDAIAASESLRYTNLRPTAWWLPLVSPDGKWFAALAQTAQARIEEI